MDKYNALIPIFFKKQDVPNQFNQTYYTIIKSNKDKDKYTGLIDKYNKSSSFIEKNNFLNELKDMRDEYIKTSFFIFDNRLNFIDLIDKEGNKKLYEDFLEEVNNEKIENKVKEMMESKQKEIPKTKITKPKKKTIPKSLKMSVWEKYIGKSVGSTKCLCCESNEISQMDFHCGHIIAEANDGKTNIENLKPICGKCNKSMGTQNLDEFKNKFFPQKIKKIDVTKISFQ